MIIPTTPGETYAVTATAPCTVSAVMSKSSPLLLITIEEPGQYLVVAPTAELYITDDSALVTRSFRSAPVCLSLRSAAGGGVDATEETEQTLGRDGREDNLNSAGFSFVAAQSGNLKTVSIQGRSSMEFHHNPVWLKVWKKTEAGQTILGLSANSAVQENNRANVWTMPENVYIPAGAVITITTHGEGTKDEETYLMGGEEGRLLARVAAITPQEGIGCLNDGGLPLWNYLPVCTLSFIQKVSLSQYARILPVSPEAFAALSPKRPQTLYFIMESAPAPESAPL